MVVATWYNADQPSQPHVGVFFSQSREPVAELLHAARVLEREADRLHDHLAGGGALPLPRHAAVPLVYIEYGEDDVVLTVSFDPDDRQAVPKLDYQHGATATPTQLYGSAGVLRELAKFTFRKGIFQAQAEQEAAARAAAGPDTTDAPVDVAEVAREAIERTLAEGQTAGTPGEA